MSDYHFHTLAPAPPLTWGFFRSEYRSSWVVILPGYY
jgi:hypothetical protein